MNKKQIKLQKNMLSFFKFRLFLILKVPLAYLAGIKLRFLDEESCVTRVKHWYVTTNPFRSMYFAVQAMAAEMSTGALAMLAKEKHDESIAMLIVGMKSSYSKKATGRIRFECMDGELFAKELQRCVDQGIPVTVNSKAIGYDLNNDIVSEFEFTWSFKKRNAS